MKRKDLIRHLHKQGCELLMEARGRWVWVNPASHLQAAVQPHGEIGDCEAHAISRQMGIDDA